MAEPDTGLMQQILDVAERQGEPDLHHRGQADDLGAGLEVAKGGRFCHIRRLTGRLCRLKAGSSDNTGRRATQPSRTNLNRRSSSDNTVKDARQ
jgi:hypothetical protein